MSDTNNQGLNVTTSSLIPAAPDLKSAIKRKFETILSGIEEGQLSIHWPNGAVTRHGETSDHEADNATIRFHNYQPIQRLMFGGAVGFAESYLRAEWDADDLYDFFTLVMRNERRLFGPTRGGAVSRSLRTLRHLMNKNSTRGSRKNIAYHYDLGNEFYALWLDKSMNYSAGIYKDATTCLAEAQQNKMNRIGQLLRAGPDDSVLEIGCGWGALAQFLAQDSGCSVDAISLSQEQLSYARKSLSTIGTLNAAKPLKINYLHQDYRAVSKRYDHIVSVEMFEAVGEEYWSAYFSKVSELLNQGGNAVFQVITLSEERFEHYKKNPDFIQRYIFPGGMLPTKTKLYELINDAGLELVDTHWFGGGYASTLRDWFTRFEDCTKEVAAQGYDDRFIRMWRYYLNYCEAGFRFQTTDVGLLACRKAP